MRNVFIPSSYRRNSLQSDIAVIQLNSKAIYTKKVRPVQYSNSGVTSSLTPGTFGHVPGYGVTEDNHIARELRYAKLPIIQLEECTKSLKTPPPPHSFCVGFKNGTSLCKGDSGGGMVFPVKRGPPAMDTGYMLKVKPVLLATIILKQCSGENYGLFL